MFRERAKANIGIAVNKASISKQHREGGEVDEVVSR